MVPYLYTMSLITLVPLLLQYFTFPTMALTSIGPHISFCMPDSPITTMPSCSYWFKMSDYCPSLPRGEQKKCACSQEILDSLYGCENELRLCFLNNKNDADYEEARSLWHSMCDSLTTVTTALLTSLTSTYANPEFCRGQVVTACKSVLRELKRCEALESFDFSSCMCEPRMILNEYTCDYLGNKSCNWLTMPGMASPRTADTTNLLQYSLCDNFDEVMSTSEVESTTILPSTATTPTITASESFSLTAPTVTPTTKATTTASNSAVVSVVHTTKLLMLLCGFYVWWL